MDAQKRFTLSPENAQQKQSTPALYASSSTAICYQKRGCWEHVLLSGWPPLFMTAKQTLFRWRQYLAPPHYQELHLDITSQYLVKKQECSPIFIDGTGAHAYSPVEGMAFRWMADASGFNWRFHLIWRCLLLVVPINDHMVSQGGLGAVAFIHMEPEIVRHPIKSGQKIITTRLVMGMSFPVGCRCTSYLQHNLISIRVYPAFCLCRTSPPIDVRTHACPWGSSTPLLTPSFTRRIWSILPGSTVPH